MFASTMQTHGYVLRQSLWNFEPQTWQANITSHDAQSACFDGYRHHVMCQSLVLFCFLARHPLADKDCIILDCL